MDVDSVNSSAPPLLKVLSRLSLDGIRPVTDPKHYRLVTLDNGLEALLIHDPRITPRADDGEGIRKRRMKPKEEEEGEEEEDEEEDEDEDEDEEEEEEEEEASGTCSSADSRSSAGDEDDEELDVDASDPSCKRDQPGPTGSPPPPV
ncbi:hypothetical protein NSK_008524 [Nannochloropsis salina CCMP1776]|uniref:Uncharacterized protein n=1 Tax=Nannochloropsis salina CCMP1776 TaxID=1027361 RepID=A0A4D9CMH9_9STRA|nr:hypothetical protein NSK_008524 [Nannochloropsis salina CCMP1776]|eukprot:TFJ79966.1 hypothetical protein NSK_008524 [Nannochloropsis salina CCMP1776]